MKITRYTTRSGSHYDVRERDGITEVRRVKLGEHHLKKGPEHVAHRMKRDQLEVWRKAAVTTPTIGAPLYISAGPGDYDTIITSPVVNIQVLKGLEN
jgi:hypothetical protein